VVAPESFDQPLCRDHPVGVEQQHRDDRAPARAPELKDALSLEHFQRPEDAKVHDA
jgi:hypothetical protein